MFSIFFGFILSTLLIFIPIHSGTLNRFKRFNKENLGIVAITFENEVTHQETWLPIIDQNGMVDYYITGRQWCYWTFRVNAQTITPPNLEAGVKKYTKFWLEKKHPQLSKARFKIRVKKIDNVKNWEVDFLDKQQRKTSIDCGSVTCNNNNFSMDLQDIESI